jgi:hypothetical protein
MPSRLLLRVVLPLLLAACRTATQGTPLELPPRPAAPLAESVEPCAGHFIDERWLSEGLLVLGELHGTEECPRLAALTACGAATLGRTAWLGLELPRDEQGRVEAFLATGDEAALLAGPFWRRTYQDGRSSQAMLEMLRSVRQMREAGRDVRPFLFDVPAEADSGAGERDEQMATLIAEARARAPGDPMVLLVGNVHASRRLKIPRSMVWHLVRRGVPLRTLDVATRGGTAWLCGTRCGVDTVAGKDLGPQPAVFESPEATRWGYDGGWYVGTLTASPPALAGAPGP